MAHGNPTIILSHIVKMHQPSETVETWKVENVVSIKYGCKGLHFHSCW